MATRRCTTCHRVFPPASFRLRTGRLAKTCASCRENARDRQRAARATDPERYKAAARARAAASKARQREKARLRKRRRLFEELSAIDRSQPVTYEKMARLGLAPGRYKIDERGDVLRYVSRSWQLARTLGLRRERGYRYFVDGEGDVTRCRSWGR
jgi:hypothetical protein